MMKPIILSVVGIAGLVLLVALQGCSKNWHDQSGPEKKGIHDKGPVYHDRAYSGSGPGGRGVK